MEKPKIITIENVLSNITEVEHIYGEPGFLLNLDVKGIFGLRILRKENADKKLH